MCLWFHLVWVFAAHVVNSYLYLEWFSGLGLSRLGGGEALRSESDSEMAGHTKQMAVKLLRLYQWQHLCISLTESSVFNSRVGYMQYRKNQWCCVKSVFEADLCEAERQWRSSSSGWQGRLEGLATQRSRREPWNRQTNMWAMHLTQTNWNMKRLAKQNKNRKRETKQQTKTKTDRTPCKTKQTILTEKAETHNYFL